MKIISKMKGKRPCPSSSQYQSFFVTSIQYSSQTCIAFALSFPKEPLNQGNKIR